MTLAIGIDHTDIDVLARRLARSRNDFAARFCTPAELLACDGRPERLADRWVAKEATMKALGQGIGVLDPRHIELVGPRTQPELTLQGSASRRAAALELDTWNVSIARDGTLAFALVIGIGSGSGSGSGKNNR